MPLALHAGLSGVSQYGKFWKAADAGGGGGFTGFKHAAFPLVAFADRGISDTFAALICHGVLERFPNLRLASIENGAMWVPDLLRNLKDARGKMPFSFKQHPVEQFKEHVWVAPYYEDDMAMLKDAIGIDRLLFGSDFPHTEGLPEPDPLREGHPHLRRGRDEGHHARQRPRPPRRRVLDHAPGVGLGAVDVGEAVLRRRAAAAVTDCWFQRARSSSAASGRDGSADVARRLGLGEARAGRRARGRRATSPR